jgi:hypothetical protein
MFVLGQILDTDALEHSGDRLIDARKRFFDRATGSKVATLGALGARCDEKWAVDRENNFVG